MIVNTSKNYNNNNNGNKMYCYTRRVRVPIYVDRSPSSCYTNTRELLDYFLDVAASACFGRFDIFRIIRPLPHPHPRLINNGCKRGNARYFHSGYVTRLYTSRRIAYTIRQQLYSRIFRPRGQGTE